ncbi:N-acetylglutamate synthase, mitochondrial-like [Rhopilema esculentum]|uniref:N-acetylglutamate synthase, mitochondrial-like n=1 Tax=Rhopilema esculentum TaxID=499914 RepID=UPI0031DFD25A
MKLRLQKAAWSANVVTKTLRARALATSAKANWGERGSAFPNGVSSWNGNGLSWDVQRFLEEVGTDGREARYWLKVFQHRDANPEQPFAVFQVSSSIFKRPHMLNSLASSLAFLQRSGLSFILVHGGNGGCIARSKLSDQTMQLSDVLESQGAKTRPFFNCSGIIKANRDEVGRSYELNTDLLTWSLSSGYIPIVSSLAETDDGKIVHICPFRTADEIAVHYKPLKVMYLNTKGGLLNEKGRVIEAVKLSAENDEASSFPWHDNETHERIRSIKGLLDKLPFTSSVVIASANTVIKELFTHKGSGTIFKKREALHVHKSLGSIDTTRLTNLIEKTFGRKLASSYFPEINQKLIAAYITESYSAAALITNENVEGVPYLDKFAVSLQNQGLGSGETIWERIRDDFPRLFWRSRDDNRINPWYFTRSEGSWTNRAYTVFWYGVNQPKISHEIINFAISKPSSFEDKGFDDTGNDETYLRKRS